MRNILWAKLENVDADFKGRDWLSLVDHSADVAAVFEAMLRIPLIARRLCALAMVAELSEIWISRLCAHVALHDFGKANRGFQAQRDLGAPRVGHVGPGLGLFYAIRHGNSLAQSLVEVVPFRKMRPWGGLYPGLRAVAAHHGSPIMVGTDLCGCKAGLDTLWAPGPDYDPIAALAPLGDAIRTWFPAAFTEGGLPLPEAPRFWHAVSGLVMLADWIGSDARVFPLYAEPSGDRMAEARAKAPSVLIDYGFDPGPKRQVLSPISFASISEHNPHPVQKAVGESRGQIVILEAETGSGKTEAALFRFARLFETGEVDGLYFALPTRVAAKSLYGRVQDAIAKMFDGHIGPSVLLAVPGYAKVDGISGRILPEFEVLWDDDPIDSEKRARWAAEHPKRFLAGTIAVGTIDQALLGTIKVKHAHMRSSSLLRHLLVVDEVHASDVYMERLLTSLLEQHTAAGGHALLLSATLGSAARLRLLGSNSAAVPALADAEQLPYPAISTSGDLTPRHHDGAGQAKSVMLQPDERISDPFAIAQVALEAAERGAKVLVIRNLHRTAVATAKALVELAPDHPALFRCNGVPTLHHGRFALEDRERLDQAIKGQMEEARGNRGLVLVGTQTLEQSLDICADFMMTDLAPADVLLQRIGRLHRHNTNPRPPGFDQPKLVVLNPLDLTPYLQTADHGLGGVHGPYRDLVVLEATRRLIKQHPVWRIPSMNRMLVERATHPDAVDALSVELETLSPAWRHVRQDIEGNDLGDAFQARCARIDWSERFDSDQLVFRRDETFKTRLGASDLRIKLPTSVKGPFGEGIETISIPSHWADGIDLKASLEPELAAVEPDQIIFALQGKQFRYGRLGLILSDSQGANPAGNILPEAY